MFRITVDNATLAAVLGGHEKLNDEKLRNNYHSITNAISKMVKYGWKLPHWAADPVVWVPREFNNAADTIVNVVMNAKAPLSFKHKDVGAIIRSGYNLKIGTDGGGAWGEGERDRMGCLCGAGGGGGKERKSCIILKGGTYHGVGMSSLAVETLALDEALAALTSYL